MVSIFYTEEQKEEVPKQPHLFSSLTFNLNLQGNFFLFLSFSGIKEKLLLLSFFFFLGISRHFQAVQHK